MNIPILENKRVKLSLLDLDNYKCLESIAQEKDRIFYSPSDISTPEYLKTYVQTAIDAYKTKSVIPFLVFDKNE